MAFIAVNHKELHETFRSLTLTYLMYKYVSIIGCQTEKKIRRTHHQTLFKTKMED